MFSYLPWLSLWQSPLQGHYYLYIFWGLQPTRNKAENDFDLLWAPCQTHCPYILTRPIARLGFLSTASEAKVYAGHRMAPGPIWTKAVLKTGGSANDQQNHSLDLTSVSSLPFCWICYCSCLDHYQLSWMWSTNCLSCVWARSAALHAHTVIATVTDCPSCPVPGMHYVGKQLLDPI